MGDAGISTISSLNETRGEDVSGPETGRGEHLDDRFFLSLMRAFVLGYEITTVFFSLNRNYFHLCQNYLNLLSLQSFCHRKFSFCLMVSNMSNRHFYNS